MDITRIFDVFTSHEEDGVTVQHEPILSMISKIDGEFGDIILRTQCSLDDGVFKSEFLSPQTDFMFRLGEIRHFTDIVSMFNPKPLTHEKAQQTSLFTP